MVPTRLRRVLGRPLLLAASAGTLGLAGFAIAQVVGTPTTATPALAADIQATKSRMLKLDIDYKPDQRNSIAFVELVASRDQGQTWEVMDTVTPDKDFLKLEAKEDGLYFLNMVIVFKNGTRQPKDPSRAPAEMKMLIDTVAPVVKITNAVPQMDEVLVEWSIDEKHLDTAKTQVLYKSSSSTLNDWLPVPASFVTANAAKFKPTIAGPLLVRLIVQDFAGNVTDTAKEVPVGITASYTPPSGSPPSAPLILPTNPSAVPAPDFNTASAPINIAPSGPITPVAPAAPLVITPIAATTPLPVPPPPQPEHMGNWSNPNSPSTPAPAPLPTTSPVIGVGSSPGAPQPQVAPLTNAAPAPTVPAPNTQFIRYPDFDLAYQMIDAGPSGISRVDLYVTRDEGRTWQKWSTHGGKELPMKVKLGMPFNTNRDGDYGLRLVPVSGAGLADDAPSAGTPPELRVHVDTVPPLLTILAPVPAANQPNGLTLQWQASDKNFGDNPIQIEWSEANAGPWKPVTNDETPTATGRTANTGQFTWNVPRTLPSHRVFLRMTATDLAGNRSIAVTSQPISIDLMKPKARIVNISTGEIMPRP